MSITKLTDRYIDIKGTKLPNMSMIRLFNILKDENDEYFMNIFKNIEINSILLETPSAISEITIIEPWWEMISYSFYDDVQAWWIACLSNEVLNPFEEIDKGLSIEMLSGDYIPYIQRDMEVIFNL
jgi:hypothetical protein